MDLAALASRILMYPPIEDVRRQDELYVTSSCSVEVDAPWGKRIYGACHRAEWYRVNGVSKTRVETPEGVRKRHWGDVIEAAEKELYKKLGIFVASQVGFYVPKYFLKGRIDCFVRNPDTWKGQDLVVLTIPKSGLIGVDVKSTWSYGSKGTIDCPPGVKPWPKWDHIIQMAVYHWNYRTFADYWQIVYLARDNGSSRTHNVLTMEDGRISVNGEIVPFTIDHVFHRLEELIPKLTAKEPPRRDFEIVWDKERLKAAADAGELSKTDTEKVRKGNKLIKGDWQCVYCEWAKTCWQGVELPSEAKLEDLVE
jgi:hypothetical protein